MVNDRVVDMQAIAAGCAAECERQHVGLDRVRFLIEAFELAIKDYQVQGVRPEPDTILALGGVVEPDNKGQLRTTPVRFPDGTSAPNASSLPTSLHRVFEAIGDSSRFPLTADGVFSAQDADLLVKQFLDEHPFVDGNGRTAYVLRNWLRGTLHAPEPLPYYYEHEVDQRKAVNSGEPVRSSGDSYEGYRIPDYAAPSGVDAVLPHRSSGRSM